MASYLYEWKGKNARQWKENEMEVDNSIEPKYSHVDSLMLTNVTRLESTMPL